MLELRPRSDDLEPERFAGGVLGCPAGAVDLGVGIDVLGADVGRRMLPVGLLRCVASRLVPIAELLDPAALASRYRDVSAPRFALFERVLVRDDGVTVVLVDVVARLLRDGVLTVGRGVVVRLVRVTSRVVLRVVTSRLRDALSAEVRRELLSALLRRVLVAPVAERSAGNNRVESRSRRLRSMRPALLTRTRSLWSDGVLRVSRARSRCSFLSTT